MPPPSVAPTMSTLSTVSSAGNLGHPWYKIKHVYSMLKVYMQQINMLSSNLIKQLSHVLIRIKQAKPIIKHIFLELVHESYHVQVL